MVVISSSPAISSGRQRSIKAALGRDFARVRDVRAAKSPNHIHALEQNVTGRKKSGDVV
jgi:hypothetical protein